MFRTLLLALSLLAISQSPALAQGQLSDLSNPYLAARRAADCHAAVTANDPTGYARDTLRWRFTLDTLGQWSSYYGYGLRGLRRVQNRNLAGCADDLAFLNAQLQPAIRTIYRQNWQASVDRFSQMTAPLETHPIGVIDQAAWCARAMEQMQRHLRDTPDDYGFSSAPEGQGDLIAALVQLRVSENKWRARLQNAPNGGATSPYAAAAAQEFDEWSGRFFGMGEDDPNSAAQMIFISREGLACHATADRFLS